MTELQAVVFDVDGTLVDSERDGHRVAFNASFEDMGLPYRWDEEEYGRLLRVTGGQRRIDSYLAGQGVPLDERNRLAPALHARKTDRLIEMIEAGALSCRPGVELLLEELVGAGVRLAVATTGSRSWVSRLLGRLLPMVPFEAVVTGDDVTTRKPDPAAYQVALERLGVSSRSVVAIEDSTEGLQSALGAGLACVVVVNGYTAEQDLSAASLRVDSFDHLNVETLAELSSP